MKFLYKIFNILIIALTLALIIFFTFQKSPKNFDGSRVKIVDFFKQDNSQTNFFIRGSNPFINKLGEKNFSYHDLKNSINQTIKAQGFEPLSEFYLIDINLLNLDSYFQILDEEIFFKKYSHLGEFTHFSEISPMLLLMGYSSNQIIYNITQKYHQDLDKIIDKIHFHLQQKFHKPIVIYTHCNAGRDRTGLISAGYRMKYQNYNLKQAINQNIIDVNRSSESFLKDAILAYCLYLQKNFNKPRDFCEQN